MVDEEMFKLSPNDIKPTFQFLLLTEIIISVFLYLYHPKCFLSEIPSILSNYQNLKSKGIRWKKIQIQYFRFKISNRYGTFTNFTVGYTEISPFLHYPPGLFWFWVGDCNGTPTCIFNHCKDYKLEGGLIINHWCILNLPMLDAWLWWHGYDSSPMYALFPCGYTFIVEYSKWCWAGLV